MTTKAAFIGHSFLQQDDALVRRFLDFFDSVQDLVPDFSWDHALKAEPKELSQKVQEKMRGKTLFIGICTPNEYAVKNLNLSTGWFRKNLVCAPKEHFHQKTSDWLLQEIGYAVGKGMTIILLIENGLRQPGGLQGDIEYIQFNRENLEAVFRKLLEMLKALSPVVAIHQPVAQDGQASDGEKSADETVIAPDADSDTEKTEAQWTVVKFQAELVRAIIAKNEEAEEVINKKFLNSQHAKEHVTKVEWEANRLFYRYKVSGENNLNRLKTIQESEPEISSICVIIGNIFSDYDDFVQAEKYFSLAAQIEEGKLDGVIYLCRSAIALAKGNKVSKLHSVVDAIKKAIKSVDQSEPLIIRNLARISKIRGNTHEEIAFIERFIELRPDAHNDRFDLAYKYSEQKRYGSSIYHYAFLAEHEPTDSVLNNLGVIRENLDLHTRSIEAYRRAEELGGALAMSNIANQLMDRGFLPEAEVLCKKAMGMEDCDPAVADAYSRLGNVRKREEKEEKGVIDASVQERRFYAEFGGGASDGDVTTIFGSWKGPDCELTTRIEAGRFYAQGEYTKLETVELAMLLQPQARKEPSISKIQVRFEGAIIGRAILFDYLEKKIEPAQDIFGLFGAEVKKSGLMIISEDRKEISVWEQVQGEQGKFYKIRSNEGTISQRN